MKFPVLLLITALAGVLMGVSGQNSSSSAPEEKPETQTNAPQTNAPQTTVPQTQSQEEAKTPPTEAPKTTSKSTTKQSIIQKIQNDLKKILGQGSGIFPKK